MAEFQSYLDRLQFPERLRNDKVYKYLTNIRLVTLLVLSILLLGLSSFFTLPRRLNPEVQIPIVVVSTVLPGAGPEDVESLVTIPLEEELKDLDGLDTISSTSQENASVITLEFTSNTNGKDAEKDAQTNVSKAVLPEDATDPTVQLLDFEDQAIWRFAIYTDASDASLISFSNELKESIENQSNIDRVETTGLEEEEITIQTTHEDLTTYGLDPFTLSSTIDSLVSSFPAGNVGFNTSDFPVSIDKTATTVQDIRQLQLNKTETTVTLGDIANVSLKSKPESRTAYYGDSQTINKTVSFSVFKTTNADIVQTSAQIQEFVNAQIDETQGTFTLVTIEDNAELINNQLADLASNFITTILLVFFTLFVFLGIRQAIIVSISIPLTFLISFTAMSVAGISINFLSLFSLLLALGLLVDDAIVIVSAMTSYFETGKFSAEETGRLVWKDFIIPIWSTTITTVWAFIPLLLSTGIIGEFIKSIPIVVSATLLASTTVAVLITLPIMIILLSPKVAPRVKTALLVAVFASIVVFVNGIIPSSPLKIPTLLLFVLFLVLVYSLRKPLKDIAGPKIDSAKQKLPLERAKDLDKGIVNTDKIVKKYENFIGNILSSKNGVKTTIFAVIIFSIFSYMLVPLGFVKNEFFPSSDGDVIYVNLEMPQGTNLDLTTQNGLEILEKVRTKEYVELAVLETGQIIDQNAGGGGGNNTAAVSLRLVDENEREKSVVLAQELRNEFSNFSQGEITIVEVSGGPPAGADVQISFLGEDLDQLDSLANQTVQIVNEAPGTNNVKKSITSGASKLRFIPDQTKIAETGASIDLIGLWLRTYVNGFEVGQIRLEDEEETDITLRINGGKISPQEISTIQIPSQIPAQSGQQGAQQTFPLEYLGQTVLEPTPTVITREDGRRTISVTAGLEEGFNLPEVNAEIISKVEELDIPEGYSFRTGGVNEENQESVNAILQAMLLSAILILVTMVLQLGSFRKAVIVLLVIPLAISGVFIMFALTGTPLSFPALIGVLALFGIVVNNSIVIVEKINQNLEIGMNLQDGIVDASTGRLTPIFLSSTTTIMGLLPITISDPLWRGLGGAIIAGLIFSGTIMLLFIPTVYYAVYKNEIE